MQYKKDVLYKRIHEDHPNMDTEYIKVYFLYIMDKIKEWSKNPDNLILNIKGLGKFYWKKKEVQMDLKNREQYTDEYFKNAEDHQRFVDIAKFVLKEYEKYDTKKVNVRKTNYGAAYKDPEQLTKEHEEFMKPITDKNKYYVNTRKDRGSKDSSQSDPGS